MNKYFYNLILYGNINPHEKPLESKNIYQYKNNKMYKTMNWKIKDGIYHFNIKIYKKNNYFLHSYIYNSHIRQYSYYKTNKYFKQHNKRGPSNIMILFNNNLEIQTLNKQYYINGVKITNISNIFDIDNLYLNYCNIILFI